ncbi:MAG: HAMP domain-containing histidine kinase, partial [Patescibacteria group bacterium]|nr:HAMP domain-containing histidine kinase [Patescibacteria group bacterium]
PVDLAALCRDILAENKPAAMQDGINIVQEGLDAVQATVHADRAKLKVVLQTLIDNALTYTKAGGTVRISLTASGHMASVAVTDTGIGMTAEESRLIFSRFYRTDSARKSDTEGMGIGLFIINKIIERHGGHLRVHSDGPGKGSTFTLSLPLRSK